MRNGVNIILDRYAYSGVAYSSAKGLSINWCKNCDIGLPKPDIVFYMKISETEVEKRDEFGDEIYEKSEFQQKVKIQYSKLMESFWTMINANDTIENVSKNVLS